MSETETHRPVLCLQVSFDALLEAFSLGEPRYERYPYPEHDVLFSCSSLGVWPVTSRGFMQEADRQYVTGESWLLDTIATLMRGGPSPRGGRFVVTLDGAHRACDGTPICTFEVGA